VLDSSRTLQTFRYEALRAISSGIIETASTTFLVLIAVRWFEAGPLAKGLIAAGAGLGYIVSPVIVTRVEHAGTPVARAASRLMLAGAVALALSAFVPGEALFVLTSLTAIALSGATSPLLTQIYQDNYPDASRGRLFSRTVVIRIVSAAAFGGGAGYVLSLDFGYFRVLLAIYATALAFSAWCLSRIPSVPLHVSGERHPLRAFSTICLRFMALIKVLLESESLSCLFDNIKSINDELSNIRSTSSISNSLYCI
jgi:hypothetical protein